jgi:hypothetical protein
VKPRPEHRPLARRRAEIAAETEAGTRLSPEDADRIAAALDAGRAVLRAHAISSSSTHTLPAAIEELERAVRNLPGGW